MTSLDTVLVLALGVYEQRAVGIGEAALLRDVLVEPVTQPEVRDGDRLRVALLQSADESADPSVLRRARRVEVIPLRTHNVVLATLATLMGW